MKHSKSPIHGYGLFAICDIEENQLIIEYTGELIKRSTADMRERLYENEKITGSYMFGIDEELVVDATKRGNLARFINHCCQPNCYAKIEGTGIESRIFIYSRFEIKKGEVSFIIDDNR